MGSASGMTITVVLIRQPSSFYSWNTLTHRNSHTAEAVRIPDGLC